MAPAQTIFAGSALYIAVNARIANRSDNAIDSLDVQISVPSGDRESITVFETGQSTGVFHGRLRTSQARFDSQDDCILNVSGDESAAVQVLATGGSQPFLDASIEVEAPQFGVVFDSETGDPVSGADVSIVDAATGELATITDQDGEMPWPSTVTSGEPIFWENGERLELDQGEFWFPRLPPGTYRVMVRPPDNFTAPSSASPEQLAALSRPYGGPFRLPDKAFGASFTLAQSGGVETDIPIDRDGLDLQLTKTASRAIAQPGDAVVFVVTITNPDPVKTHRDVVLSERTSPSFRLRTDTVRLDGAAPKEGLTAQANGAGLTFELGDIGPGETRRFVYAMTVRTDASPGNEEGRSTVSTALRVHARGSAALRIIRESVTDRMTIIGRVTTGACSIEQGRIGVSGVRIMMEDGSFAITDRQGRYHFDGGVPGTHVVQAARATLPEGAELINCNDRFAMLAARPRNMRSVAGAALWWRISMFACQSKRQLTRQTRLTLSPIQRHKQMSHCRAWLRPIGSLLVMVRLTG